MPIFQTYSLNVGGDDGEQRGQLDGTGLYGFCQTLDSYWIHQVLPNIPIMAPEHTSPIWHINNWLVLVEINPPHNTSQLLMCHIGDVWRVDLHQH